MSSGTAPVNATQAQGLHQNVGAGTQNNNSGPGTQYIARSINIGEKIIQDKYQIVDSSLNSEY